MGHPNPGMILEPGRTALVLTDLQNDFLNPGGNGWAYFRPDHHTQAFWMDGEWTPPRAEGYAIELWVQADMPSPNAYGQTALVSAMGSPSGQCS